jgi:hypothetical protein
MPDKEARDGTGAGLIAFLEQCAKNGEMNESTAESYRTTVIAVFESIEDPPDPAKIDVRTMDVGATLDHFAHLRGSKYQSSTLTTYRSRFHRAVAMYKAWLNNEPGWRRAGRGLRLKATSRAADRETGPQLMTYALPLRTDLMINITLPVELTAADAKRVANFVNGLVFDEAPATSSRNRYDENSTEGG